MLNQNENKNIDIIQMKKKKCRYPKKNNFRINLKELRRYIIYTYILSLFLLCRFILYTYIFSLFLLCRYIIYTCTYFHYLKWRKTKIINNIKCNFIRHIVIFFRFLYCWLFGKRLNLQHFTQLFKNNLFSIRN